MKMLNNISSLTSKKTPYRILLLLMLVMALCLASCESPEGVVGTQIQEPQEVPCSIQYKIIQNERPCLERD